MKNLLAVLLSLSFISLIGSSNANADWTMRFTDADFGQNPVFNEITEFEFEFVIAGDLQRGTYVNPPLVSVNYTVFGDLPQGSTSGYPFFTLVRAIDGQEFYDQGSSISFEILPSANLFDGLQADEVEMTFVLNCREVDNVYDAVLPASPCGTEIKYFVTVDSTASETFGAPPLAPSEFFTAFSVESVNTTFDDNFETDFGWTVSGDATDGQWNQGIPIGGGDRSDPPVDGDGSGSCYVTDNTDGNSDVDGGSVVLTSPTLTAVGGDNVIAVLSYYRWYANNGNDEVDDVFEVEISNDNGTTWVDLETLGPTGADSIGGWIFTSFIVSDFVTPTAQMQVRFIASDIVEPSIVEAGVDGVKIDLLECNGALLAVPAASFNEIRGSFISGTVAEIAFSDDTFLKYNPGFVLSSIEAPVWLEFDANLASDTQTIVEFAIEVTANTPGLTQTTDVFNFTTGQYEEVDVQSSAFNSDTVISIDLSASAADVVEAGTGAVRMRTGWRRTGFTLLFPWTICIDQAVWNVSN